MKTNYAHWIIIVLLASAGASMAAVVNVPIPNSSFESPAIPSRGNFIYGVPTGWTQISGTADHMGVGNYYPPNPDGTSQFLAMTGNGTQIGTYSQGTLTGGHTYTFKLDYRKDTDAGGYSYVRLWAVRDKNNPWAEGGCILMAAEYELKSVQAWKTYTMSFDAPSTVNGWYVMIYITPSNSWDNYDGLSLSYDDGAGVVPPGCVAAPGAQAGYGGYAKKIIHSKSGIELVLIAPGTFTMGTNLLGSDCLPPHAVTINYPFYMGKTEVTNGQYGQFNATGYNGTADVDPAYDLYLRHLRGKSYMPSGNNYPVVWVSWKNAKAFCNWAGGLDLASEAEWEYACRAGTTAHFSFGDDKSLLNQYGWTLENAEGKTHPVAALQPNQWGLCDMHGNVWEWVLDDFVYKYDGAPTNGSARLEGKMTKALRSGSWSNSTHAQYAGSASRFNSAPTNASNDTGFRVVLRP